MPALFALGDKWTGNPQVATFAAFGCCSRRSCSSTSRGRCRSGCSRSRRSGLAGAVLVCVGTLASRATWLAVVVTAVVGLAVLFAGVVSSVIASATTPLLLSFILPVSLRALRLGDPGPTRRLRTRGGRLATRDLLLWPAPRGDRLRGAAISACRGIAGRLRAEAAFLLGGHDKREKAVADAAASVAALHKTFYGTPYRPTGLSTSARAIVAPRRRDLLARRRGRPRASSSGRNARRRERRRGEDSRGGGARARR